MEDQVRAKKLLAALSIWSAIALVALFYFSAYARADYLKKGDEISLRRGVIPAPRGQILDKNGVKLAWSETYYDLYLTRVPTFYLKKSTLFSQLEAILGPFELKPQPGGESLIRLNLTPQIIKSLQHLVGQYRELSIRLRFERLHHKNPSVAAVVGDVDSENGVVVGTSGLELKFDEQLRGQEGSYVVMIDSQNRWIPGKWKLEHKVVPGSDIILKRDFNQLILEEQQ